MSGQVRCHLVESGQKGLAMGLDGDKLCVFVTCEAQAVVAFV